MVTSQQLSISIITKNHPKSMYYTPLINSISQSLSLPPDIFKTALSLFLNIFFSFPYRSLPSPSSKNIYTLTYCMILLFFLLEQWILLILAAPILSYVLIWKIRKRQLLVSAVISFGFLLFVHCYRFLFDYTVWKVDCSVFMMLVSTKMTYYGLYVQTNREKSQDKESKSQHSNRVQQHSFIDYMAYMFFFPGVIGGPTFSFDRYLNFIHLRGHFKSLSQDNSKILKPLLPALILIAITAVILPLFPPYFVLQNQTYLSLPFLLKISLIIVLGFFYRVKYFVAWYFGQVATNIAGISFDESGDYRGVVAGDLMFELEANPKKKNQLWSSSIQVWMKIVIYEQVAKIAFLKNYALAVTFVFSAFWHGVYLTYYVVFFFWGILTHLSKWAYKWSLHLPKSVSESKLFYLAEYMFVMVVFTQMGMIGAILNWDKALEFQADTFFFMPITMIVLLVMSLTIKPPRSNLQKVEKQQ